MGYVVIITSLLTEFIDIVDPFSVSSFLNEDKFWVNLEKQIHISI